MIKKISNKQCKYIFTILNCVLFFFLATNKEIANFKDIHIYIGGLLTYLVSLNFYEIVVFRKNKLFSNSFLYIIYIFSVLFTAFCAVGKLLFLNSTYSIILNINNFCIYLLVCIFIAPVNYLICYYLMKINIKNDDVIRTKRQCITFFITLFVIISCFWLLTSYGYFPGNMSTDSSDIWAQAIGNIPIRYGHPPFLTIVISWLSLIWKCPFVVIVANTLFFAYVLSKIFTYLYKKGAKKIYIYIFLIPFLLCINNISMISILWKDICFTIALLWLTFELYILLRQEDCSYQKFYNYIPIIISLLLVRYFRINGIVPYIIGILILFIIAIKYKKIMIGIVIFLSILLNILVKYPLYNLYDVKGESDGASISSLNSIMFRGLAAIPYYGIDVSDDIDKFEKIMDFDLYTKYYNPYNNDTYAFTDEVQDQLENADYNGFTSLYLKYLFKYPGPIIRNQFDSTNLLWSFQNAPDGFMHIYHNGITIKSYLSMEDLDLKTKELNEYNDYNHDSNIINKFVNYYKNVVDSDSVLTTFFWRPGLFLCLFFLFGLCLIKKNKKILISLIPYIMNIVFWFCFLSHQSYRYLWFIFVITYVFIVISLFDSDREKVVKKK